MISVRYHKFQLYFEDQFDAPLTPKVITFETDFGVTFGTFTCFDIIFYSPAVEGVANGIRNFVFPSAWVDELPFLTGNSSNEF
jgi:biotinidase